jgi:hypothetical protein
MIIQTRHTQDPPISGLYELFHQVSDSTFFVNSPCVFTEDKLLKRKEVYELHDFLNDGAVKIRYIKLLWINLKGFDFYIIGVDILTGVILRRQRRLNADELPCSFLIAEPLYFLPEIEEKVINAVNNGNTTI